MEKYFEIYTTERMDWKTLTSVQIDYIIQIKENVYNLDILKMDGLASGLLFNAWNG